jgi:drug/metabolite transporter (DMT)-like permease
MSSVVGKDLIGAFDVGSLLSWRFSVAAIVLWAALMVWRRRGGPDPFGVPWVRILALGVLMGVLVVEGFYSLQRLDASVYIVLVYLYPAFVVAGSTVLGRPLERGTVVALGIVTVGVVLTVPEVITGDVEDISVTGIVLALVQAVLFAAYMLLNERFVPTGTDGVVTAAWTSTGACLVTIPLALATDVQVPHRLTIALEVALFALIPTVAATVCFFRALRHISPSLLAMIMTAEVALTIAWSGLFLGEEIRLIEGVGAAVVIVGVILAQRSYAVGETKVAAGI